MREPGRRDNALTIDRADQFVTKSEERDLLHRRDAVATTPFLVAYTTADDYVEELARDHARGAVTDSIVRLAVIDAPSQLRHLEPTAPGGNRGLQGWLCKYVCASHIARGQLVRLAVYCGVATVEAAATERIEAVNRATALRIQEAMNRVKTGVHKLDGLDVRGGGLYFDGEGAADPDSDTKIAPAPSVACATCGTPIHYANDAWRDEAMQPEVMVDAVGRGGRKAKRLDHIHDPEVVGRMV
jgi:hypothetical protein